MLKIELQGAVCARQTEENTHHPQRSRRSLHKIGCCCDLTQILFTALLFTALLFTALLFTAVADQGASGYVLQATSTSRI